MSPKISILAAFLSVAPAVLASNQAFKISKPMESGIAIIEPPGIKFNNPVKALRTSITPPTVSPSMKREIAKPMDMIVPIKGIFLSILANGFKAPKILPMNPLPNNLPANLKGAVTNLENVPNNPLAPAINILIPPDIPILDSIFKAPLNGPSVRRPIIKAPTPPNSIKRPPSIDPFLGVSNSLLRPPVSILLAFGVIFCTDVFNAVSPLNFFCISKNVFAKIDANSLVFFCSSLERELLTFLFGLEFPVWRIFLSDILSPSGTPFISLIVCNRPRTSSNKGTILTLT